MSTQGIAPQTYEGEIRALLAAHGHAHDVTVRVYPSEELQWFIVPTGRIVAELTTWGGVRQCLGKTADEALAKLASDTREGVTGLARSSSAMAAAKRVEADEEEAAGAKLLAAIASIPAAEPAAKERP